MYLDFAWALFATILYIYHPNYVCEYFIHLLCDPSFVLSAIQADFLRAYCVICIQFGLFHCEP